MPFSSDQLSALAALGIDPATLTEPTAPGLEPEAAPPARRCLSPVTFEDAEWAVIVATGALPADPPQAQSMTTRTFVGAVVAVVATARAWTDLEPVLPAEAVRKRFARLAAKGVWQRLALAVADSPIAPARQLQFASAARRAASLRCCAHLP